MSSVKASFKNKIKGAKATANPEGANGYVGDNPHETQANKTPSGTNTGASTQMKKKKTTGSTGSGVNIV